MSRLVLRFDDAGNALPDYFKLLLKRYKVGFLMSITGSIGAKIGTGKSYSALKLAEEIDPSFNIDKVAYSPVDFLRILDAVEKSGRAGQVVVLDESELTAPSREWHSFFNKAIADTLATFRYLRCMVICVTPVFGWLDSRIRPLVSFWAYPTLSLAEDTKKKMVHLRVYKVRTDMFGEKIFFSKLRFYDNKKKKVVIGQKYLVGLPSAELVKAYEDKSKTFKDKLRKGLLAEAETLEKIQQGEAEFDPTKFSFTQLVEKAYTNDAVKKELMNSGRISTEGVKLALENQRVNVGINYSQRIARYLTRKFGRQNEATIPTPATG